MTYVIERKITYNRIIDSNNNIASLNSDTGGINMHIVGGGCVTSNGETCNAWGTYEEGGDTAVEGVNVSHTNRSATFNCTTCFKVAIFGIVTNLIVNDLDLSQSNTLSILIGQNTDALYDTGVKILLNNGSQFYGEFSVSTKYIALRINCSATIAATIAGKSF